MRNKNSAFEADSAPEGLGLGEGDRGGATWVGAACRSRGRGREGYPSALWGASVNALRDIGQRLEGYPLRSWGTVGTSLRDSWACFVPGLCVGGRRAVDEARGVPACASRAAAQPSA